MRRWERFAALLVVTAAVLVAGILVFAYAIDPYDTGRSALFAKPGVRPQGPRTANASRGRDAAFNAAVFGNSHIQLLSPERLRAKTGLDFVQLTVPATGPKEQFVLIDWFLRHRQASAKALVVAADAYWCTDDPALTNAKPFPFWMYSRNPAEYAKGLFRYDILEEFPRRIGYVLSRNPERAPPDGYWDYEPEYLRLGYKADPALRARLEQRPVDNVPPSTTGRFPAADVLRALASALPTELALILVFPPNYAALLPQPGTARAETNRACKAALAAAARAHDKSAVIDWQVDRPENHQPDLYFDQSHYRQPIARAIEDDVADAVKHLRR
jgi:hypothetical protein